MDILNDSYLFYLATIILVGDQITPSCTEPHMPQGLKQKGPRHRVKCFSNVQFEKKAKDLLPVQSLHRLLHEHEIIVYASPSNKRTLICSNHGVQARCQAVGKDFCDELGEAMHWTYWAKVFSHSCVDLLRNESNICHI